MTLDKKIKRTIPSPLDHLCSAELVSDLRIVLACRLLTKPYKKSEGIPVITEMIEKETCHR